MIKSWLFKHFIHFGKACRYSWQGLKSAFKHEIAFRQEVIVSLFVWPFIFILHLTMLERAIMIASMMLVFVIELINSAIEAVVDRFGDEQHPLSGRAKDIASAAVCLAIINFFVVFWLVVIK